MSQLVALIIAIALGAIITAIGFVYLGDTFTKNSSRAVALSLASQANQINMAITAYKAENAKTPFDNNYDTTMTELVTEGYLKDVPVPYNGNYKAYQAGTSIYLVIDDVIASGIGMETCLDINKQAGLIMANFTDSDTDLIPEAAITDGATAKTALENNGYGCFEDAATATKYVFVYNAG